MVNCVVVNCNSSSDKRLKRNADESVRQSVRYFRFPREKHLNKIWVRKCGRKKPFNTKIAYICSKHFTTEHYKRSLKHELLDYLPKNMRILMDDAVPTENLPNQPSSSTLERIEKKKLLNAGRAARIEKRKSKQIVEELLAASDNTKSESLLIKESTNICSEVIVPDEPVCEHREKHELSADPQETDKLASEVGEADQLASELGETGKLASVLIEPYTFASELTNNDEVLFVDFAPPIGVVTPKTFADKETSIESIYVPTLESELLKLRYEIRMLKQKNDYLRRENGHIKTIFNPRQRHKLQKDGVRIQWTAEEIADALEMFVKGRKAYRFLLTKKYPLPSVSTLKCWRQKIRKNNETIE